MVLELARPSEPWCFLPGADFFEAVLLLAVAASSRRQQNLWKNVVFLGFQTGR